MIRIIDSLIIGENIDNNNFKWLNVSKILLTIQSEFELYKKNFGTWLCCIWYGSLWV